VGFVFTEAQAERARIPTRRFTLQLTGIGYR